MINKTKSFYSLFVPALMLVFFLSPQTMASPVDKTSGLPATAFLFVTVAGGVTVKLNDPRSLVPFIGKVDEIKIPGNKRNIYNEDLRQCYVLGYGRFDAASYRVSFDRGTLYCRPEGGEYSQVLYNGETVDEGLNKDIPTRALALKNHEQLAADIAHNTAYLRQLKNSGLALEPFIQQAQSLPIEEIYQQAMANTQAEPAFRKVPVNTKFGILLRTPVVFNQPDFNAQ